MIKTDGRIIKLERKEGYDEYYVEATIEIRFDGKSFAYKNLILGDVEITQE